jgi:HD-GYP domain-containing protein (c-di-GMP phosphodiesterase class II)
MAAEPAGDGEEIRAVEVVASLSLATDLSMGFPFEHGLHCALSALRLADALGADEDTRFQVFFGSLLCYAGCTADAEIAAAVFEEGGLLAHFTPAVFGSRREFIRGVSRAVAGPDTPAVARAARLARLMPRAVRGGVAHVEAMCQVAVMLTRSLGMPEPMLAVVGAVAERWDGHGGPVGLKGAELPTAVRIVQVARDTEFQRLVRPDTDVVRLVRQRAGGAFDPAVANVMADRYDELVRPVAGAAWHDVAAGEPGPGLVLHAEAVEEGLTTLGRFADLVSPCFSGHSAGVAELAGAAAEELGLSPAQAATVRRAGLVHDLGRVAVPARVWLDPAELAPDDWELVRLHAYQTERCLAHSPYLARLAAVAGLHHERADGSGYHRGCDSTQQPVEARLLAAADAFRTRTEPRAHRPALATEQAANWLREEARLGRLDPGCCAAVVTAAGMPGPRPARPAGLTEREAEVVGLLAHGLQTKQIARALGISAKTADRHIQNSYRKIGVSTRAAAAVYAMQHGLADWGELPMAGRTPSS